MKRFAVVGSGIAGLAAARSLAPHGRVTLFEAAGRFGGHSHTVDLTLEGVTHGVDTGFLVFNEKTYPALTRLFGELGVATAPAEMSLSVQARPERLEWSGCNLDTVFAQRANLARPAFWRMLADLLRFNREATALASDDSATGLAALDQPIGEFLAANRYSQAFRDWYFLPMVACIWSCPTEQMLRFPVATLIRFCHNHGLLQVTGRPQWRTVRGGARTYVNRMVESIADARLNTPVRQVRRTASGGEVSTDSGSERFDAVVLACHSDQSLALLADPSEAEREVLGAIRYHPNRAVLHTDTSVLPQRRRAWAAWNYERGEGAGRESASVCLHYLINRLQPLPFAVPVIVSLNPLAEPAPGAVHGEFEYAHPVFDRAAIAAQARLPALQGRRDTWFCGAWTRYGFHEDGLASGLSVARRIVAEAGNQASPTLEAEPA
ncbi:MAG: NAD(P)/FAD-dependent oxidoreductase [Caldimonas sp.]